MLKIKELKNKFCLCCLNIYTTKMKKMFLQREKQLDKQNKFFA